MKFFKKSKFDILNLDRNKEKFLWKLTNYVFLQKPNLLFYVNTSQITFYNEEHLTVIKNQIDTYEVVLQSSKEPLVNKNIFKNKIVNYIMEKGKKQKAYKIYNNAFKLFFNFFKNYNIELASTYNLYETYYNYAQKNQFIFFEPIFIYTNLVSFLQPSFTIAFKKTLKTKKNTKKPKEVIINYIKPNSRFYFCVKSIQRLTKSYEFNTFSEKIAFTILNLFLSNKNSHMYKKKITSYQKLIKLRKTK